MLNTHLLQMAEWAARVADQSVTATVKEALVPPGGGGDPSAGAAPPPGGAAPAPAPAPAPPGGDPAATAGGPPPGPIDPAMLTQITQAIQMATGGGGAGGAGGKGGGKKAEQQILSSQMRILTHLVVQIAQKMDIQVDPALLVGPPGDPSVESQAMQEMTQTPAVPTVGGGDPAAGMGAPPPGGMGAPPPGDMGGGMPPKMAGVDDDSWQWNQVTDFDGWGSRMSSMPPVGRGVPTSVTEPAEPLPSLPQAPMAPAKVASMAGALAAITLRRRRSNDR